MHGRHLESCGTKKALHMCWLLLFLCMLIWKDHISALKVSVQFLQPSNKDSPIFAQRRQGSLGLLLPSVLNSGCPAPRVGLSVATPHAASSG